MPRLCSYQNGRSKTGDAMHVSDATATLLPYAKQTAKAAPLSQLLLLGLTAVLLNGLTMYQLSCTCNVLFRCVLAMCMQCVCDYSMCYCLSGGLLLLVLAHRMCTVCFCGLL